jgi:hemerythrin-like domain-containing protein
MNLPSASCHPSRRQLIKTLALTGGGMAVAARASTAPPAKSKTAAEPEVTPTEDLMREHGLLKRVLLIYDEVNRRIADRQDFPIETVTGSAGIIQKFIEGYHEKLEEDYLFPRFRKAGKLVDLVDVLLRQHQAGRGVTARILQLAPESLKNPAQRSQLALAMNDFVRMYAPHEAREDTILFSTLHSIVSRREFDALREEFEDKEHQFFGEDGFENMVEKVAGIEKQLGIYDLAQFTPK